MTASNSNPKGAIGFIEDFALAEDRTIPLKQLIPGTEDYYYYHCLHYLNCSRYEKAEEVLDAWIDRHGRTTEVIEIEHRKKLLEYSSHKEESLEYIRQQLNIYFDHQREIQDEKPELPTRFCPDSIQFKKLAQEAFRRNPKTSDGFEEVILGELLGKNLKPNVLRHLLKRLYRPDINDLVSYIISDLKYEISEGFGSFTIHNNLTFSQLNECKKKMPSLLDNNQFISVYLKRLQPGADVEWQRDSNEREVYLKRLWDFVSKLAPAYNSLKAHVLYHRLKHDQKHGVYDRKRFESYLKLPRNTPYMNATYIHSDNLRNYWADLFENFQSETLFEPVNNDENLVRDFLQHFFTEGIGYKKFLDYIQDDYLKECYAETKIINQKGDMEEWYSMLPPAKYQLLKERIDLDFLPTNKKYYEANEEVKLTLRVKNIETLIIKIYEINTENYYRQKGKEISTNINLDGLVANVERVETYKKNALLSVIQNFHFPELNRRGIYIVEFIGNGKSSRALVRKGSLRYHERIGIAGHVFTIFDEKNNKLDKASVWIAGHEYKSGKDGTIAVPFSTYPQEQSIIIKHNNFACLESFYHTAEDYILTAGIYVDRESLLKYETAKVIIRPSLAVNNIPVTLKILENPRLEIISIDHDGISSRKEVPDFLLFEEKESLYEFQVPDRLSQITFTLKARVRNVTKNEDRELSFSNTFRLNEIDKSERVEEVHLSVIGGEYFLDVLGKTGEPMPDYPISLVLKHKFFTNTIHTSLQTDTNGRIFLGRLVDINWIRTRTTSGRENTFYLKKDQHSYPDVIHATEGETVCVPYMGTEKTPNRIELGILELRGSCYYKDLFDEIFFEDGFIKIKLAAGDYELVLKDVPHTIAVHIAGKSKEGDLCCAEGYAMNSHRHLQLDNRFPLQINTAIQVADNVQIQLKNVSKTTRVHIAATRYLPAYSIFDNLNKTVFRVPKNIPIFENKSNYISGRDIGDEYRYILDRKYATKFPGNMLKKPELLLNPWAMRKTDTEIHEAKKGEAWRGDDELRKAAPEGVAPVSPPKQGLDYSFFSNLDFLNTSTCFSVNLIPDEKGIITIKKDLLKDKTQIHVIAVDSNNTVYRTFSTFKPNNVFPVIRDLSLDPGLQPDAHFTEQNQISILTKTEEPFIINDISTSDFAIYDTLDKVYQMYMTISGDATLGEFDFIIKWPQLSPKEKKEKYSKYACHELNFFIFKKDPEFFKTILPYLQNKKDKTFLDYFLLDQGDKNDYEKILLNYLKPWAYGQLNIVERILLSQRIKGEGDPTHRHISDLLNLLPPDMERFHHLFKTALKTNDLDVDGDYGFRDAKQRVSQPKAILPTEAAPAMAQMKKAVRKKSKMSPLMSAVQTADSMGEFEPDEEYELEDESVELSDKEAYADDGDYLDENVDHERREQTRRFYQQLDQTEEFAENNYYKLSNVIQNGELITINPFWRDYAEYDGKSGFLSKHVAEASQNFTEMMFALSVLDFPFQIEAHDFKFEDRRMECRIKCDLVVFHREIMASREFDQSIPILVSQNFFRHDDRYRYEDNRQFDKYVTEEFLDHVVYGCQVVITNPTSAPQKLDILTEIPQGAIPVLSSFYTNSVHIDLDAYNTQTLEYFFYFPRTGLFHHYPVHVSSNGNLIAYASPFEFKVVKTLSKIDTTTWAYISQYGSENDVLNYIDKNNIHRVDLERIAWRMSNIKFYKKVIQKLHHQHVYNHTLWSYSIKHKDVINIREYLKHCNSFVQQTGEYLQSELLNVDAVIRKTYQHLEYSPLVNPRVHQFGKKRVILNDQLCSQYHRLMRVLSFRETLNDDDKMSVTYYLLLQDRIKEALAFFEQVNPNNLDTRIQYDYFNLYLAYHKKDFQTALNLAKTYADYPVDRWHKIFASAAENLLELVGDIKEETAVLIDEKDHTEIHTKLAATEASFDFKIETRAIALNYQHISEIQVNYYLMDIELLFSMNPFVKEISGNFSTITPNLAQTIQLDTGRTEQIFDLPTAFQSNNVLIEIEAAGIKKSQPYFANSLNIQVIENYGQLKVEQKKTFLPLSTVYIKVYAKFQDGNIRFYKDGYTDPRGRFDYVSLNTDELNQVEHFSILILSENDGAIVQEAAPPKR